MSNAPFTPTCTSTAPTAPYTDQQNINYGLFNSKGQFIFGTNPDISNQYVSPATLPSFPIRPGGNASQIHTNQNEISLFNALNAQQQQVYNTQTNPSLPLGQRRTLNGPIFKSDRDRLMYIKAQYSQAIPGTTATPTYSVNTLFNMGYH